MKTTKHWLHILLTLLTGGLWLPVYVIVIATTEMFNRGYREGKAAGRVEKSNEYEEAREDGRWTTEEKAEKVARIVESRKQSRVDRFAELADRNRSVGLDTEERAEFNQLRQELSR
jgi:hypothetical protein